MVAVLASTTFGPLCSDTPPGAPLLIILREGVMADHFLTLLHSAGYATALAGSPEAACDLLSRQEVSLALVDVEWGYPAIIQIAEAAHRQVRSCPVGVVVGWWDERVGDVYRMADFFIYKPPTERQLLAAVESALRSQLLHA